MNKKNIKRVLLSIFVLCEVFLMSVPPAFAKFSVPSTQSVIREVEQRYHIDPNALQNFGEGMNVADKKGTAPEVTVLFSPHNPKPGEKITAQAIPTYFSNPKESLYFTWYLRHAAGNNTDWDGSGAANMEDYKIEAMRTIAQGGWIPNLDADGDGVPDPATPTIAAWYAAQVDGDNDGYRAIQGGDNKLGAVDHCYLHDFTGGKDYELVRMNGGNSGWSGCGGGTRVCAANQTSLGDTGVINPITGGGGTCVGIGCSITTINPITGGGGDIWNEVNECVATGSQPYCRAGTARCDRGTPICAPSLSGDGTVGNVGQVCGVFPTLNCTGNNSVPTPTCDLGAGFNHLFAQPGSVGNDSHGIGQEEFWGTNPQDADTADNGFNDEATIAGLGQDTITWTYERGDKIGVVIEGTALNPTKYENGSNMIMWAFLNNDCPIGATATIFTSSGPYTADISATAKDLTSCLDRNWIDPAAGDSEKMELELSSFPEDGINDPSPDNLGDVIFSQAILDGTTKDENEINYVWTVEICTEAAPSIGCDNWQLITGNLKNADLIDGGFSGNGLSSFNFKLGMQNAFPFYNFPGGVGYLRISVLATEDYGSGARQARSSVIRRVISTTEKINAHTVNIVGARPYTLSTGGIICVGTLMEKAVCYVTQNEIIGLTINPDIDGIAGDDLNNFNWELDGKPLFCDTSVAANPICSDTAATSTNFFPVTKKVGESYTVKVTATNTATGKKINLVRRFEVVEPFIWIKSNDAEVSSWPKLVGAYSDIDAGAFLPDYSKTIFNTVSGNAVDLIAEFHPAFIQPDCTTEWLLDGLRNGESTYITGVNPAVNPISMTYNANKDGGEAFNVEFDAMCNKTDAYRNAAYDIWDISQFGTADKFIVSKIQQEVVAASVSTEGPAGFLANLSSNLPGHIMFLLRVALTVFVILITSGIVFSLGSSIAGGSRENR